MYICIYLHIYVYIYYTIMKYHSIYSRIPQRKPPALHQAVTAWPGNSCSRELSQADGKKNLDLPSRYGHLMGKMMGK